MGVLKLEKGQHASFKMCELFSIKGLFFFFINLFLAALGLCCCAWAFSSGEQGLLFVVGRGLLIAVASLVAEHRL